MTRVFKAQVLTCLLSGGDCRPFGPVLQLSVDADLILHVGLQVVETVPARSPAQSRLLLLAACNKSTKNIFIFLKNDSVFVTCRNKSKCMHMQVCRTICTHRKPSTLTQIENESIYLSLLSLGCYCSLGLLIIDESNPIIEPIKHLPVVLVHSILTVRVHW